MCDRLAHQVPTASQRKCPKIIIVQTPRTETAGRMTPNLVLPLSLYLYLCNQNQTWQSDFLPIRGPPPPMSELQLPNSITAPKVFQIVDLKRSRRSTTPSIPITGGSGKGADRRPRSAPCPNDRSLSSFLWMNQPTTLPESSSQRFPSRTKNAN